MANLQFNTTVLHNGTLIPGQKIEDNKLSFPGAIIDLANDVRGLKDVAASLIERGLAHETNEPATHTLTVVNAAQEAMPLGEAGGTSPVADSLKRNLAYQKELGDLKEADVSRNQPQVQPPVNPPAPAPVDAGAQPSPEEIAATAAQVQ